MKKQHKPLEIDSNDSTQFLVNKAIYMKPMKYLGFKVMKTLSKPEINSNKPMLTKFYNKYRQLLIISCKEIKKR